VNDGVQRAAERLSAARRVTVLTGAGVSAASGIPTFRGAGGLWKKFRAEDLATPGAFVRDPRTVWEWYDWRRQLVAKARPNPAHETIAAWSRAGRYEVFTLVTQNVDGLHELAGTRGVIRFHGSIWQLRCANSCGATPSGWEDRRAPLPEMPPRCPDCRGLARPGVVWFGEAIPAEALDGAQRALDCDVCVVAGTSSLVTPAAWLVDEARAAGAFTIEVNPEATPATSRVDCVLAGKAEEILPAIEGAMSAVSG
jgi:NAD-dependent deacetylase